MNTEPIALIKQCPNCRKRVRITVRQCEEFLKKQRDLEVFCPECQARLGPMDPFAILTEHKARHPD